MNDFDEEDLIGKAKKIMWKAVGITIIILLTVFFVYLITHHK
jgi:hypothetical protein